MIDLACIVSNRKGYRIPSWEPVLVLRRILTTELPIMQYLYTPDYDGASPSGLFPSRFTHIAWDSAWSEYDSSTSRRHSRNDSTLCRAACQLVVLSVGGTVPVHTRCRAANLTVPAAPEFLHNLCTCLSRLNESKQGYDCRNRERQLRNAAETGGKGSIGKALPAFGDRCSTSLSYAPAKLFWRY